MTRDQHEIRRKLRVLEYADKIGDAEFALNWFSYRAIFALIVATLVWVLLSAEDRLSIMRTTRRAQRLG